MAAPFMADAQCHTVDLERLLFTRMIVRLGRLPAEMLYLYNMPYTWSILVSRIILPKQELVETV